MAPTLVVATGGLSIPTLGATGFGGHTGRRRRYQPMLMDMPKISPAYPYRCDDCAAGSLRCANELEQMIKWQGPENVACFIVEPVVGATMGAVVPPPGYFQRIRQICDRYDVLFIMDEVNGCRCAVLFRDRANRFRIKTTLIFRNSFRRKDSFFI